MGDATKCNGVTRKARTAISDRWLEILLADSAVAANGVGHDPCVGTFQAIANLAEHVGEGYFHRDVGIYRNLGQLGIDEAHACNVGLRTDDFSIDALEQI